MMLELGVSRMTEVSLMGLGLSRTSAVALSQVVIPDDLTPEQALAWLHEQVVEQLPVPVLVRSGIAEVLKLSRAA